MNLHSTFSTSPHRALVVLAFLALAGGRVAAASDCEQTSTGLVPLPVLGAELYLDQFQGGLYPAGSNAVPQPHRFAGVNRGWSVTPRLPSGAPAPGGSVVLLSIGNIRQVFLSSRSYGGYASTPLNPEPFAYESGFAVKWLIEAQIEQMQGEPVDPVAGDLAVDDAAPWLAWGPYLWADGETPNPGGLFYVCTDFQNDGTHPSPSGQEKIAGVLLDFMLTSPFTMPWFRADGGPNPADLTGDGQVGGEDLGMLLNQWGACDGCAADYNGNGIVAGGDLGYLLLHWSE